MQRFKLYGLLFFLTLIFSCVSIKSVNAPEEYIISKSELLELIKQKDKTLVLFWTNWCSDSKYALDSLWKIQGNFANKAPQSSLPSRNLLNCRAVFMIFPKHRNREFSDGKQGTRVADQGTVLPVWSRFKSRARNCLYRTHITWPKTNTTKPTA